jgi:hypothetical protein
MTGDRLQHRVNASHRIELINTWGEAPSPGGKIRSSAGGLPRGVLEFRTILRHGVAAAAPAKAFGHCRRLAAPLHEPGSNIIDPGDPVNFAPYYALRPMAGPTAR